MDSPHAATDKHVIALIHSHRLLEADPQNAIAHFEQGIALCQLGQSAEAIAAWTQAATLEPTNAFGYINIGIVQLQLEQWSQAEQAFRLAAEREPERVEAHYGLGLAFAQQGQHEAARMAWQETLRLAPGHADARANLAALMEQHVPQEVFSTHIGLAQTLQMECVVLSVDQPLDRFIAQREGASSGLPASSLERASDLRELPEPQPLPATRELPATQQVPEEKPQILAEKPRIKLPEMKGPPLESIAGLVFAAHDARVIAVTVSQGKTSPSGETVAAASGQEQDMAEPTLEFDSEDLKKKHARLRRRQGGAPSSSNNSSSNISSLLTISFLRASSAHKRRALAVAVGAAFMIILLTYWNLQGHRSQPASPPASWPPVASLTSVSTSLPAPYSEPDSPVPQPASAAAKPFKPGSSARPVVIPPPIDLHAQSVEQGQRPRRRQHAVTQEMTRHATRRRIPVPARPAHAVRVQSVKSRHEEDTFSGRSQAKHMDTADEWTDHLPSSLSERRRLSDLTFVSEYQV